MEFGLQVLLRKTRDNQANGGGPMAGNSIKWLSHASFSIQTSEGKVVLIDPWITGNPLSPVTPADITKADMILVTHGHFDHAGDAGTISKNTGGVIVGMPETVSQLKEDHELPDENIVLGGMGMNIGGTVVVDGIAVTMTQAFHSSETGSPCGYIVKLEDGTTVYHAGDTGIFGSMQILGDIYSIDVALLPIGSVFTMDPVQAVAALKLLKPKKVIPMHFKTFPILVQDADAFVELAGKEIPAVEVVVLEPNEAYPT